MNPTSPLDAKEIVRQAVDIVDVIGEAYELRRQGRNYVCRCPWHDDNKPSLTVNQERQTWRCWVCDIGGDVYSFVMKRDGVGFREALELLAERVGVELHQSSSPPPQAGSPGDKKTLYAAMAWAESQFHRFFLESPQAAEAREYVASRGISQASVERFRIGYAPDSWDWLKDKATAAGYSNAVLARVGLLREKEGGGAYDFFRGRVMFPICDLQARPIALGGRILPSLADKGGGKYVNSPETPLYSKSNQLYALHLAREAVNREGVLAVMEGYTDVVMAHQHDLTNVVAVCGTALGEQHLKLIQRFTDKVALVLDGDTAGQRRASEVLELFVGNRIDLRILTLPESLDPCDFIATPKEGRGVHAFRELLNAAPDALQHKLDTVTNGLVPHESAHAASHAAEEVLATLARAAAGAMADSAAMLRQEGILSRLASRLRLPQEQLRTRLGAIRQEQAKKSLVLHEPHVANEEAVVIANPKPTPADQELLELMLLDSECANTIAHSVSPASLESEVGRVLCQLFFDAMEVEGCVELAYLMNRLDDEGLKSVLVGIDESAQDKIQSDKLQRLADVVRFFKQKSEKEIRANQKAVQNEETLSESEKDEALFDLFNKLRVDSRQTRSLPTEG